MSSIIAVVLSLVTVGGLQATGVDVGIATAILIGLGYGIGIELLWDIVKSRKREKTGNWQD